MKSPETDIAQVLIGYVRSLKSKRAVTCDVIQLPFPKKSIKSAIEHYLRTETDKELVVHLELLYQSLADFQHLSSDERESVNIMENLGDTSDLSDGEFRQVVSNITKAGPIYHRLRSRIWEESQQLQQEFNDLRNQ